MIFLPVTPVSPSGPPVIKLPVGFTLKIVLLSNIPFNSGFIIFSTLFLTSPGLSFKSSLCWVLQITFEILKGLLTPLYSTVTCAFPSGPIHS